MTTPRDVAYSCLQAVDEGAYANLVLPTLLGRARLTGRDAAFATELAYGTIRMQGLYDAILAVAAGRPVASIEVPVLRTLRLGAHQALSMNVPDHAAVHETVSLVRQVVGARATGFANAVMRRVVERDLEAWRRAVAPSDGITDVALRHSHPEWVASLLAEALASEGRDGELEHALASGNVPAPVTLAARPGLVGRDALLAASPGATTTPHSPYGVLLAGGDPGSIRAVAEGGASVQDEGSQLAVVALVEAEVFTEPGVSTRWLDACAGPGGKAGLLGAMAAARGATLDAIEVHPHRADLVRSSVRSLPPGVVTVTVADAIAWHGGPYQRILLDAPCTGLGALRRRPEVRWRRAPADLVNLVDLQVRLARACIGNLAPGGVLAYVTCSPVLAETHDVVARAIAEARSVGIVIEMLDARVPLAQATETDPEAWGKGPAVQLWTHAHGTDSMFIALLRRGLDEAVGR